MNTQNLQPLQLQQQTVVTSSADDTFTQEITLPSKGLLNANIPNGRVTQRCMMVADQKYLTSSVSSSDNQIHQILQRTTTQPQDFDIKDLSVADTLYMLFKLRILSYGNIYKFKTRCPVCGEVIEVSADLTTLNVNTLDDDYKDHLSVQLPHRKDTVHIKMLTNRDLDNINNEIQRRKRKNTKDESDYVLRLVGSIESIDVVKDKSQLTHPIDIERYVSGLTDYDAATIIHARDSIQYGIDPVYETICPECRNSVSVDVGFTKDFFRPSF